MTQAGRQEAFIYFHPMIRFLLIITSIAYCTQTFSQKLIGTSVWQHTTSTSVTINFVYKGEGNPSPLLRSVESGSIISSSSIHQFQVRKRISVSAHFEGLSPGTTYEVDFPYSENDNLTIKTFDNSSFTDSISFLAGSCFFLPSGPWRFITPSVNIRILKRMNETSSDLMLWLGDNLYYVGSDFTSEEEMFRKQVQTRKQSKWMKKLLRSRPHYSIWDDHDFGPNNANGEFPLKESSLKVHRSFWSNPYPEGETGSYYNFSHGDIEFFMLDNRYHRFKDGSNKQLLGQEQLKWLKKALLSSSRTVKFIALGSQTLNDFNNPEFFSFYPEERKELLDFIVENKIQGVIFLSGDRHFSEVVRKEYRNRYFTELTSSPVLSWPRKLDGSREAINPNRVDGSLTEKRNYSRVTIFGPLSDRKVRIQIFNKKGKEIFRYTISNDDLRG